MKLSELKLGQKLIVTRKHTYNNGYPESSRQYTKIVTQLPKKERGTILGKIDNKWTQFVVDETGWIVYFKIGKARYEIVD